MAFSTENMNSLAVALPQSVENKMDGSLVDEVDGNFKPKVEENAGDIFRILTSGHCRERGEKLTLALDTSKMFVQLNDFVAFSLADNVLIFVFCKVDAFRILLFTDEEPFMVINRYNDKMEGTVGS